MPAFIHDLAQRMARQSRWMAWMAVLSLAGLVVALVLVHQATQASFRTEALVPGPMSAQTHSEMARASDLGTQFQRLVQRLASSSDPSAARLQVEHIQTWLNNLPREVAALVVRDFLDSSMDAVTRMGFKLDQDGGLKEAPTLRAFLLDYQSRLDLAEAADYAVQVLEGNPSADEWALALRNLARAEKNASSRSLLERKFKAMLLHDSWRDQPSAGYLEAFDVAVYLGGEEFVPMLADLVGPQSNQAVAHAAYLALDRLTLRDPNMVLQTLLEKPALMNGMEVVRAGYFARGRVEDAAQRRLLERYLLSPGRSATELKAFANLFPNANFIVSNNLLTRTPTPNHETLIRMDRASLQAVREWMSDSRFQRLKPHLQTVHTRLLRFVQQAAASATTK